MQSYTRRQLRRAFKLHKQRLIRVAHAHGYDHEHDDECDHDHERAGLGYRISSGGCALATE